MLNTLEEGKIFLLALCANFFFAFLTTFFCTEKCPNGIGKIFDLALGRKSATCLGGEGFPPPGLEEGPTHPHCPCIETWNPGGGFSLGIDAKRQKFFVPQIDRKIGSPNPPPVRGCRPSARVLKDLCSGRVAEERVWKVC